MLRYPGGKSRLKKLILPYLRPLLGNLNYAEVMVGGGSIAVAIGEEFPEKRIILNDLDPDVSNFWKVASGQLGEAKVNELRRLLEESRGPSDDRVNGFEYWKAVRDSSPTNSVERAFRFLMMNKTTFGGQIGASPVGGKDQDGWQGSNGRVVFCQYNVDNIIKELDNVYRVLGGRTTVYNTDVLALLSTLEDSYMPYIDPPYFPGEDNKLYRYQMSLRAHAALAEFLEQWKHTWVLSYDEHPEVRRLYAWADLVVIPTHYSHGPGPSENEREAGKRKQWKHSSEILVLPKNMTTSETTTVPAATPVSTPSVTVKPIRHRRPNAVVAAEKAAKAAALAAGAPVPKDAPMTKAAPAPTVVPEVLIPPITKYVAYACVASNMLIASTISPTEAACRLKCSANAEIKRFTITIDD